MASTHHSCDDVIRRASNFCSKLCCSALYLYTLLVIKNMTTIFRRNKIKGLVTLCVMFGMMGVVGSMDYQDQIDDQAYYCERINEGYPNYKNIKC